MSAESALLYFMSPNCGACRAWTPKLETLSLKNQNVFVIDVSNQFEIARALNVMATPSAIEVREGRVTGTNSAGSSESLRIASKVASASRRRASLRKCKFKRQPTNKTG